MDKRKILKSTMAGMLLKVWTPPVITAISLPAHAELSCNDIDGYTGFVISSFCDGDAVEVHEGTFLRSDTHNEYGRFNGEILNVYATNPIHTVRWEWERNTLEVWIRELLSVGCTPSREYLWSDLSPGELIVETSCGTVTFQLGRDGTPPPECCDIEGAYCGDIDKVETIKIVISSENEIDVYASVDGLEYATKESILVACNGGDFKATLYTVNGGDRVWVEARVNCDGTISGHILGSYKLILFSAYINSC